jgi:hypothetical protein
MVITGMDRRVSQKAGKSKTVRKGLRMKSPTVQPFRGRWKLTSIYFLEPNSAGIGSVYTDAGKLAERSNCNFSERIWEGLLGG